LIYSRENYRYELRLAQALIAAKRTEEALTYLMNLWQREPENGAVNLELARIYAQKQDITQALRYYHDAIYAVWQTDADAQQRAVRIELIKYLLNQNATNQAESELIALGRNLPEDPTLELEIADLFMQVPDYERALAQYLQVLKMERHNSAALAGAGRAAFELSRYPMAERYLRAASISNPADTHIAELLDLAKTVPKVDPYEMYSTKERDHATVDAFNTAGERLNACLGQNSSTGSADPTLQQLYTRWMEMKSRVTERAIREHPEWFDPAMNLVFSIERETSDRCGAPTGTDLVLLLVARRHPAS
jgi:tetratricopeptide (TPR) repeat protein